MSQLKHVAIVGATGAVGVEMLRCLEERNFPVGQLTLLASARSAGKKMTVKGQELTIKELTPDAFEGVDIALFSAGGGISKEFAPHAVKAGAVVVDNSSAFRMDPTVPLVVPEVNAADVKTHQGIIANPNCTTAITLMALYPLHQDSSASSPPPIRPSPALAPKPSRNSPANPTPGPPAAAPPGTTPNSPPPKSRSTLTRSPSTSSPTSTPSSTPVTPKRK